MSLRMTGCFTSLTLAASCRAQQQGSSYFYADEWNDGYEGWRISNQGRRIYADFVPSLYSAEVTDGYLIDAEMKCKDVNIIY